MSKQKKIETIDTTKEEYTYDEIESMVATVTGWFAATKEKGYTDEIIEEYRSTVAAYCDALSNLIDGGCLPIYWEEETYVETNNHTIDDPDDNGIRH